MPPFASVLLVVAAMCSVVGLAQNTSNTTTTTLPPSSTQPVGNPLIDALPTCPFWQGEPRYCYECRWCPFRESTCCEMEDEVDVLKSVNVSGSDDWDCFITIVHFQQCGRCSPDAKSFVQQTDMAATYQMYVWDARNLSIRPCRQACHYIYKQCNKATLLNGNPIVPGDMPESQFCASFPEVSTPELPCYNGVATMTHSAYMVVVVALMTVVASSLF